MSEGNNIALTAIATLCGGIVLFVITRIVESLFITPLIKLREQIGVINDRLIYYADRIANPAVISFSELGSDFAQQLEMIRLDIRSGATQLRSKAHAVPGLKYWHMVRLAPSPAQIKDASKEIIGLSNSLSTSSRSGDDVVNQTQARIKKIERSLNIEIN